MRLSWGRLFGGHPALGQNVLGRGDNLPTTAGPLTDSVWLGLTIYCGMMIATLAVAEIPFYIAVRRSAIVSGSQTYPVWAGLRLFLYGWGVPPIQEESGNRKALLRKCLATRLKNNFMWFMYHANYVSMMA